MYKNIIGGIVTSALYVWVMLNIALGFQSERSWGFFGIFKWIEGSTWGSGWLGMMIFIPHIVFQLFCLAFLPFLFMKHVWPGKRYIPYRICFAVFCLACSYIMGLLGFLRGDEWLILDGILASHLITLSIYEENILALSIMVALLFLAAYVFKELLSSSFPLYIFDVLVIAFMIRIGLHVIVNRVDLSKRRIE